MKIAIDCRHIDSSGIGVYLRECLPFFLKSSNSFLLLGDSVKLGIFRNHANAKVIHCIIKPFTFQDTFFFPRAIVREINKSDIFYSPYFNIPSGVSIPTYTTIHDIIFPDIPELTSKAGLAARMYFYRRCFRHSKKIFTVSEFSKSRIEFYLKSKKPVIVTYSAIQPYFIEYTKTAGNVKKNKIVIFIGNIKKNKGLEILLEAFRLAKEEGLPHQLIIVGSKDNFRTSNNSVLKKIDSLGSDTVIFTGFIPDEKLAKYLSCASLLVQPSLYEGFCLPPLEAMVLGTKVLISDIRVLKEIYTDYPVAYFRSGDIVDLKEKLLNLLLHNEPASQILSNELLSKYSFEKTANTILKEFN